MKRFLFLCTVLFFIAISMNRGFLVNVDTKLEAILLGENEVSYKSRIDRKKIFIEEDSEWKEFEIFGININGSKPGSFSAENLVSKNEYLRWFEYIYDMNINCLRVTGLMGEEFYEALDEFNDSKARNLYLLQGIYFDEIALKDGYDIKDKNLTNIFKENIKSTINAVHGTGYIDVNNDSSQNYTVDISDYVIGYTLGIEWAPHDLLYTEIMNESKEFNGEYFYTDEEASVFEMFLAEVANYTVKYEVEKFNEQKLISFIGSAYNLIKEIGKDDIEVIGAEAATDAVKNYLDVENIKSTEEFKSGIFISYNVYPDENNLLEYNNSISELLNKINEYHTIPVVISEFGIPSSRLAASFIDDENKGYINESEQGELLVRLDKEIRNVDMAGGFLLEWQDSWYKSSWNTVDSKILDQSPFWSDAQTYSQSFGLMAFDPGKGKSISYPDNSIEEWNNEEIINKNEYVSLSVKSDEKYVYFMARFNNEFSLDKNDVYIDINTTPKSGSKTSSEYDLVFEEPVDFIVKLDSINESKILTQKYYSTYEFFEDIPKLKLRPNNISVKKDMDEFVPIKTYTKNRAYIESSKEFLDKEAFETGTLVHGNGNPEESDTFNSAADFYVGEDYIELRIPWALLNFMNPANKKIHDDYYESFDITPLDIEDISIGFTVKEKETGKKIRLSSKKYSWDSWMYPSYHERLKQSYYIYKDYLRELKYR